MDRPKGLGGSATLPDHDHSLVEKTKRFELVGSWQRIKGMGSAEIFASRGFKSFEALRDR